MADSRREKLVQAIVTRMKLINGAGSYATDIDDRVADSETNWAQDQATLPAISVFDGESQPNPTSTGRSLKTIHLLSVLIKYFAEQGTTAAACRNGIKDIKTAIRQDDKWIVSGTQLAMQTYEGPERIMRNPDTYEVEGAEVEIVIQYETFKFNAE